MYIAIDLGNKRVGVAYTQENIALPYGIIQRIHIIKELKKIMHNYGNIHTIVVGLPYDLYGKNTLQLERTEKFIGKLKQIFPHIDIVGHDERFSSFLADEGGSDHRDDVAAQYILQSYLESAGK